jgi:hypothetical protein
MKFDFDNTVAILLWLVSIYLFVMDKPHAQFCLLAAIFCTLQSIRAVIQKK